MRNQGLLSEPLIKRLIKLFLLLGLLPALALFGLPIVIALLPGVQTFDERLLVFSALQGAVYVIVVVMGATITLRHLALPIQGLIKGAEAIRSGDFSYRVAVPRDNSEMTTLVQTFNAMADSVEHMRNDIEEQRAALQDALDAREQEFQVILEISALVNKHDDLTSNVKRALHIAREHLGTDMISLVMFDEDKAIRTSSAVFTCEGCPHIRPQTCESCQQHGRLRHALTQMQDNLIRQAVEEETEVRVFDVDTADATLPDNVRNVLNTLPVKRMLIKPLKSARGVVGVLVLMRQRHTIVPERSRTLLNTLAENITVLIENWYLQHRVRTLTVMEERRRLASELHDSVTQSLFSLILTAQGLKSVLASVPGVDNSTLDVLIDQSRRVQSEIRSLINEMRPIELGPNDLEGALRQHVQSLRDSTHAEVKFTINGNTRRIPQPVQQCLNRVAQEALSNAARHAAPEHVHLDLEASQDIVTMTITDDGKGFDTQATAARSSDSLGLVSMRERAEMLGGALLVRSRLDEGTTIAIRIPICNYEENTTHDTGS